MSMYSPGGAYPMPRAEDRPQPPPPPKPTTITGVYDGLKDGLPAANYAACWVLTEVDSRTLKAILFTLTLKGSTCFVKLETELRRARDTDTWRGEFPAGERDVNLSRMADGTLKLIEKGETGATYTLTRRGADPATYACAPCLPQLVLPSVARDREFGYKGEKLKELPPPEEEEALDGPAKPNIYLDERFDQGVEEVDTSGWNVQ